jgi:hypothetical protein
MGRPEDLLKRLSALKEAAIDELIQNRQSEEHWLDFKRAATTGSASKLHGDDRKNLARAISGFGNSEGGIVVWGVDCTDDPLVGDVAKAKLAVEKAARFKSWLESAVSDAQFRLMLACSITSLSVTQQNLDSYSRTCHGAI